MFQKDGNDVSIVEAANIVCNAFVFAAPLSAYVVSMLCAFAIALWLTRPLRNMLTLVDTGAAAVRHHDQDSAAVAASEQPYDPRLPLFDPHAFTLWCRQDGEGVEPVTRTRLIALASEYCEFTGRCRLPARGRIFRHVKAAGWRFHHGRPATYSISVTDTAAEALNIIDSARAVLHAAEGSEQVVAVLRVLSGALARVAEPSGTESPSVGPHRQAARPAASAAEENRGVPGAATIRHRHRHDAPVYGTATGGVGNRLQLVTAAAASRSRSPP
jgi:hypothetical protein